MRQKIKVSNIPLKKNRLQNKMELSRLKYLMRWNQAEGAKTLVQGYSNAL